MDGWTAGAGAISLAGLEQGVQGVGGSRICGHSEKFGFYSLILNSEKALNRTFSGDSSWEEEQDAGRGVSGLSLSWQGFWRPGGQQCTVYSHRIPHFTGLGNQELWGHQLG